MFTRVRPKGRCVHLVPLLGRWVRPGSLGSLGSGLGVVGLILVCRMNLTTSRANSSELRHHLASQQVEMPHRELNDRG